MCNKSKKENAELIYLQLNETIQKYLNLGLTIDDLHAICLPNKCKYNSKQYKICAISLVTLVVTILSQNIFLTYFYGIRCLVPNNYFIWEASRPISNCNFCVNVTAPIVLINATQSEFAPYAYTSQPVVIKHAFLHWPAINVFSLKYFRELYESVEDSHNSVNDECQFLHFKSNFISIKDVFAMTESRALNLPGERSWYVGWGNCHPQILEEMRKHYFRPHFLPDDSENPYKDYVFMGYDDGATMHLDFINRLMWQAQLKGSKLWKVLPPPECEDVCTSFEFVAEPGDAVLVDTRIWYHGTTIAANEFSLSVQSEYG